MKNSLFLTTLCLFATLTACSSRSSATPIPTIVLNAGPVNSSSGGVSASGVIVPASKAQLSFPLTGVVKSVAVKAGDRVLKNQTLVMLDTAIWEAKVRQAEADVVASQANEKYLIRTGEDQEHIDAANADLESDQAALEAAKATLAQATLMAPFDGTIASVDIAPGETVTPGREVIMIGDLSTFQVETTDLSERDAPLVQAGQSVSISVKALDAQFPGKVVDIQHVSSTLGGDVVYKVTIAFDAQPEGLLWGMTTDVEIQTGK